MKALEERRKEFMTRYPQWWNMTLYQGFAFKAAQCPDRVFFVVEGKYYTYAEVLKEADRISAALWSMGLREEDIPTGKSLGRRTASARPFAPWDLPGAAVWPLP